MPILITQTMEISLAQMQNLGPIYKTKKCVFSHVYASYY